MELEVVIVQDPPGLGHILGLLFDEAVDCGALQVIAQDVELVLRLDSIVQVLRDVHVLFRHSLLAILSVRGNLDLVDAEDFAEGGRLVVEERLAQVVDKGLVELGFSLAAGDRSSVF